MNKSPIADKAEQFAKLYETVGCSSASVVLLIFVLDVVMNARDGRLAIEVLKVGNPWMMPLAFAHHLPYVGPESLFSGLSFWSFRRAFQLRNRVLDLLKDGRPAEEAQERRATAEGASPAPSKTETEEQPMQSLLSEEANAHI